MSNFGHFEEVEVFCRIGGSSVEVIFRLERFIVALFDLVQSDYTGGRETRPEAEGQDRRLAHLPLRPPAHRLPAGQRHQTALQAAVEVRGPAAS